MFSEQIKQGAIMKWTLLTVIAGVMVAMAIHATVGVIASGTATLGGGV
jgi:hypothetical protein